MKLRKSITSKNFNNKSVCILLTDHKSINEIILLKSLKLMEKSKIKNFFFVGDKKKFSILNKKLKNKKKFHFINCELKNNYFNYINKITEIALNLYYQKKIKFLINMPLNKKKFFKNKYEGFTEFFSNKVDGKKNENMLLYNELFSVCPVTTHTLIKKVDQNINSLKITKTIKNINYFFSNIVQKKIEIVVLGLNPHASKDLNRKNKDYNIIRPIIKKFKKRRVNIIGPVSADTAFSSVKNKVFIGMYHDQVLTPFKILNKMNGINITIGKKILRLSPDHGTGEKIINNKNKIKNESFMKCINFCEKFKNV